MSFTDKFKAKYDPESQNLPIIEQKKPSLAMCRSCSQFEEGSQIGRVPVLFWCISKEWDRIKKCSVTCYKNIEFMDQCPKRE